MNRLILIGNGFDLAHGLKTLYKDFIKRDTERLLPDYYLRYQKPHQIQTHCTTLKFGKCANYEGYRR